MAFMRGYGDDSPSVRSLCFYIHEEMVQQERRSIDFTLFVYTLPNIRVSPFNHPRHRMNLLSHQALIHPSTQEQAKNPP